MRRAWVIAIECHSGRRVVGATVGPLTQPLAGWVFHSNVVQRLRRGATYALLDNEHRYTFTLLEHGELACSLTKS
jgi:hypothetical protein